VQHGIERAATMSARTAVWWVRRDLRLADNPALARAAAGDRAVVPVFVVDADLLAGRLHRDAARRRHFLFAGLRALDRDLRARGARLVVRRGRPRDVLPALVEAAGAEVVIAESDVSPYARRRDAGVRRVAPLELVGGPTLHHPADVVKADGTPYTVFSPFRRAWLARGLPARADLFAAPTRLPAVADAIASETMPAGEAPEHLPAGEIEARDRLRRFARGPIAHYGVERDRVDHDGTSALSPYLRFGMLSIREAVVGAHYGVERDRVDHDGTSALSPYLRFGMLSIREAVVAAIEAGARGDDARPLSGADVWLTELAWRDFYQTVLFHHPAVLRTAFDARLRSVAWRRAPRDLAAWQEGRTGYPIVDAAMRQLATTGWIHNRARMIVASILTKDLLVDWRLGEAWFMRHLVDGDPAANNGGWQWTAGVGTDAAPYFRIFNPVLQAKKFDPDGAYVRRWVPELARVPAAYVHEPWTMTPIEQQAVGCLVGRDYPTPIVEHAAVRERTLAAYKQAHASA
jgi:deoxyribodipyrimidine photo-lyase